MADRTRRHPDWAWSGIAYHWLYFREINPAATLFAALFVLQAALFLWQAVGSHVHAIAPFGVLGVLEKRAGDRGEAETPEWSRVTRQSRHNTGGVHTCVGIFSCLIEGPRQR